MASPWLGLKFHGPLEVRPHAKAGGGRGVFTVRDISAGEMVMREEPVLRLLQREGSSAHVQLAELAVKSSDKKLLEKISWLHPRTLEDVSKEGLKAARARHGESAVRLSKELNKTRFDPDACLLIILKMQLNAFQGGLFIRMAMVNHSANPNLHKFQPGGNVDGDNPNASEARAIRDIKAGEEVTWSYFSPLLEATPTYQNHLFVHQHYVIPAHFSDQSRWPHPKETLEMKEASENDPDLKEFKGNVSTMLSSLERKLGQLEELLERKKITIDDLLGILESLPGIHLLGPRHVVRARAQLLVARACQTRVLSFGSDGESGETGFRDVEYAACMLEALREVEDIQSLYLPKTHIAVGATLADAHAALTFLLAKDRSYLYKRFPTMKNFALASREELRLRQISNQIQSLYSSRSKTTQPQSQPQPQPQAKTNPADRKEKTSKPSACNPSQTGSEAEKPNDANRIDVANASWNNEGGKGDDEELWDLFE
ncbi:hypothetical protein AAMO2058_001139600 [Amorphochlora amoebiformis]